MTEKRFVGGPYGFYDRYKGDRWLWSEWEYIIEIMNNLDTKARERSKALSKLQKENEQLKKELDQFYLLIGRGDWSGLVDLAYDFVAKDHATNKTYGTLQG